MRDRPLPPFICACEDFRIFAMNRSFRARESQMQGSVVKQRQQLRASMMKEKEEDLVLFLEMRRREKERDDLLLNSSEEFEAPLESKPGTSPVFLIPHQQLQLKKLVLAISSVPRVIKCL